MRDKIRDRLRSTFDPRQLEDKDNLLGLYKLIHISQEDPVFYRQVLSDYGFLTYAFKDAFGFGLPLDDLFLDRIGVIDEIGYVLITHGEAAAQEYAKSWTVSSRHFKRMQYSIRLRQERFMSKVMRGQAPDQLSPLEQAILKKRGLSPQNITKTRSELLEKLNKIHADAGLITTLNLKENDPETYREALLHFGRLPRALAEIGITEEYVIEHLKETGIIDKMLLWYLDGRKTDLRPIKEAYHIHQRRFNFFLDIFEEKRTRILREDSQITGSSYEDEVDAFLHSERLDDDIYILHQHHSPYAGIIPSYAGRELCDFRIGNTLIEVAGGLEAQGFFPSYAERLQRKISLTEQHGIQLIILTPKDFKKDTFCTMLLPVLDTARKAGIKKIAPEDLFTYDANDTIPYYFLSCGQQQHFKNKATWWNQ